MADPPTFAQLLETLLSTYATVNTDMVTGLWDTMFDDRGNFENETLKALGAAWTAFSDALSAMLSAIDTRLDALESA